MKKLGITEIKQALLTDERFRNLFPEIQSDINELLKNPGCSCINKIIKIVYTYPERLKKYFPNHDVPKEYTFATNNQSVLNNWQVINCNINELEAKIKELHKFGKKQIALARYEDQITVLINSLP